MSRKAYDNLKVRIYKQQLQSSGRLPDSSKVEKTAQKIATTCDNREREAKRKRGE